MASLTRDQTRAALLMAETGADLFESPALTAQRYTRVAEVLCGAGTPWPLPAHPHASSAPSAAAVASTATAPAASADSATATAAAPLPAGPLAPPLQRQVTSDGTEQLLPVELLAVVIGYLNPPRPLPFAVRVKSPNGRMTTVEGLEFDAAVSDLKARVRDSDGVPPDRQRLLFTTSDLKLVQLEPATARLSSFGVGHGALLRLILAHRA